MEEELRSNKTSDVITEEDGDTFFFSLLKQETGILISSFTFPALKHQRCREHSPLGQNNAEMSHSDTPGSTNHGDE